MAVEIRHYEDGDLAAVAEVFRGQHVVLGTMRLPHASLEQLRKRLVAEEGTIQLVGLLEGQVVGFCELVTFPNYPRHRHAGELNMIAVHEAFQGRGVARVLIGAALDLADNWLNLHRVGLTAWVTNERALALYRRMGFVDEGILKDYVFREGRYVDACVMGRIRP